MKTFKIYILAADTPFYEGECESVIIPSIDGQYGVLAHHSNMIKAIVPGSLIYKLPNKEKETLFVSSGLIKVENNEVLILVDSLERPEDIDKNRAKRAADAAKEKLLQNTSIQEYKSAQAKLARALNRLKVKETTFK